MTKQVKLCLAKLKRGSTQKSQVEQVQRREKAQTTKQGAGSQARACTCKRLAQTTATSQAMRLRAVLWGTLEQSAQRCTIAEVVLLLWVVHLESCTLASPDGTLLL